MSKFIRFKFLMAVFIAMFFSFSAANSQTISKVLANGVTIVPSIPQYFPPGFAGNDSAWFLTNPQDPFWQYRGFLRIDSVAGYSNDTLTLRVLRRFKTDDGIAFFDTMNYLLFTDTAAFQQKVGTVPKDSAFTFSILNVPCDGIRFYATVDDTLKLYLGVKRVPAAPWPYRPR